MSKKIYSVKDVAMGFDTVFVAPNDMMALRVFADTCKEDGNQISAHPDAFCLYALGELNSETGIENCEVKLLGSATEYVKK